MNTTQNFWRKCSSCKKDIPLNSKYYECNVSTCTGLRTGYAFCSVSCWEVHLPGARHRDAGAVEKKSPSVAALETPESAPRRILVSSGSSSSSVSTQSTSSTLKKSSMSHEVLVVVSKMKQYIKDLSEMNTSEDVNQIISEMIRIECEKAITKARADGRKTVMARDFK
jgi:histone H3/H4